VTNLPFPLRHTPTLCSYGNLCKSDTIVGSTTREMRRQIGCNLLLTKFAMRTQQEVRINCSFFPLSLLQAHVVECAVELPFAFKKKYAGRNCGARTVDVSIKKS